MTHKTQEELNHLVSFPLLNPNPVIEVGSSGRISFFNPSAEKALERFDLATFGLLRDMNKWQISQ
jgi:hypothetical protein